MKFTIPPEGRVSINRAIHNLCQEMKRRRMKHFLHYEALCKALDGGVVLCYDFKLKRLRQYIKFEGRYYRLNHKPTKDPFIQNRKYLPKSRFKI